MNARNFMKIGKRVQSGKNCDLVWVTGVIMAKWLYSLEYFNDGAPTVLYLNG